MRTKEFIKRVEELGFRTKSEYLKDKKVCIYDINDYYIASVITNRLYGAYICGWNSGLIEFEDVVDLVSVITEYIITPIEEREEPKRYYLRHKWIKTNDYNYLTLDLDDNTYELNDIEGFDWTKNKFTREEIEEIKEKYNTDLSDFEIVGLEE